MLAQGAQTVRSLPISGALVVYTLRSQLFQAVRGRFGTVLGVAMHETGLRWFIVSPFGSIATKVLIFLSAVSEVHVDGVILGVGLTIDLASQTRLP